MTQFKSTSVVIKQIITHRSYSDIFGLGSDQKVYVWSHEDSAWKKYWVEKDKPEE